MWALGIVGHTYLTYCRYFPGVYLGIQNWWQRHMWTTCPESLLDGGPLKVEPATSRSQLQRLNYYTIRSSITDDMATSIVGLVALYVSAWIRQLASIYMVFLLQTSTNASLVGIWPPAASYSIPNASVSMALNQHCNPGSTSKSLFWPTSRYLPETLAYVHQLFKCCLKSYFNSLVS